MNLFHKSLIVLIVTSATSRISAQQNCKVSVPALSGLYEGDCKDGKAWGSGKAQGEDLYIGEFKNGLPDGKGVYQWKNGNTFKGQWLKGKKQGIGEMTYKKAGKKDSLLAGFWQKDKYTGLYETPYLIHSHSSRVIKITVSKNVKSRENNIYVEVQNMTGGGSTLSGVDPKPEITDVTIVTGDFLRIIPGYAGSRSTATQLNKVIFPFRAVYKFGSQQADIEILEPGNWKIIVNMNN